MKKNSNNLKLHQKLYNKLAFASGIVFVVFSLVSIISFLAIDKIEIDSELKILGLFLLKSIYLPVAVSALLLIVYFININLIDKEEKKDDEIDHDNGCIP